LAARTVVADTIAVSPQGFNWQSIGMLVVFIAIFYFLLIRPQMRRSKAMRNLLSNLSVGDEVMTSGGIVGRIEKLSDSFIEVAIADNVVIKVQKQAVVSVVPKGTMKSTS
jgi:preprotein translocase subunit YajC